MMHLLSVYKMYVALRTQFVETIMQRCPGADANMLVEHALGGSLKFADAYVLWHYLQKHRPARVLEVGSFLGFSSRWLLECGREWDLRVTSVDPNIRHRIFNRPRDILQAYNAQYCGKQLEVITAFLGEFGDSVDWHYKKEIAKKPSFRDELLASRPVIDANWERKFDFIFIDGDHSYASARNNFEICLQLLAPGGMITMHDAVSWPGVAQFMKELRAAYDGKAQVDVVEGRYVFEHPAVAVECVKDVDGIGVFCPGQAPRA
jgi:predicted O-methyltransferase YrrM